MRLPDGGNEDPAEKEEKQMKKVLCLALCALLCLSVLPVAADTYINSRGYPFAISYPDEGYYVSEKNAGYIEESSSWNCGSVYADADDGLNWTIRLYQEQDYASFNLADYDPQTDSRFADYCNKVVEWFSSRNLEVVGYCSSAKDGVTFAVFTGTDEYGPLLIADTMMNGWEVNIEFYAYTDGDFDACRALTDADYAVISEVLESFARR